MRVLSLNAWGGRLHDRLLPYLVAADPDVLCLQEVVRAPAAEAEWLVYRDGGVELPQRANLFREVAEALPGHAAFFCPAARGPLFDDGRAIASEWGLATFVRRRHPVIGQAQGFVHGDFAPDGFGEHPRPRNAHAVRVFDDRAGFAVTVAHLHGLRDPAGKHDTPARRAQAEALIRLTRTVARPGERLVVCGDLNVLPGSETLATLGGLGLTELVTLRGHAGTRTSFYAKPGRFADYMLVSPEVRVVSFDVVAEPEVSDHRALLLELA
jgi:endonuclease/exonuclease/phosphatase family metal-dependent hydrolase